MFSWCISVPKCPRATRGSTQAQARTTCFPLFSCPRAITPIRAKPPVSAFASILDECRSYFSTLLCSVLLLQLSRIFLRNKLLCCGHAAVGAEGDASLVHHMLPGPTYKNIIFLTGGRRIDTCRDKPTD